MRRLLPSADGAFCQTGESTDWDARLTIERGFPNIRVSCAPRIKSGGTFFFEVRYLAKGYAAIRRKGPLARRSAYVRGNIWAALSFSNTVLKDLVAMVLNPFGHIVGAASLDLLDTGCIISSP